MRAIISEINIRIAKRRKELGVVVRLAKTWPSKYEFKDWEFLRMRDGSDNSSFYNQYSKPTKLKRGT